MHSFPPLKMTMELQWNGDKHATFHTLPGFPQES
jgi:hypothetical protein